MGRRWDQRVREIENKAYALLQEVGISTPPVRVRRVAEHFEVTVRPSKFKDEVSGLLSIRDGRPTIGYNNLHPSVRRRFTIAHEMGHYILHRNESDLFVDKNYSKVFFRDDKSSEGEYIRELEANAFAASLLMPRAMLQKEIAKRSFDLAEEESLDKLANAFQVSRQAMAYRLANLGIFNSAPDHL